MEEIATFIFRFIGYLLSEIILGTFFYWLGWPFVKLATFGKYPQKDWKENYKVEKGDRFIFQPFREMRFRFCLAFSLA